MKELSAAPKQKIRKTNQTIKCHSNKAGTSFNGKTIGSHLGNIQPQDRTFLHKRQLGDQFFNDSRVKRHKRDF